MGAVEAQDPTDADPKISYYERLEDNLSIQPISSARTPLSSVVNEIPLVFRNVIYLIWIGGKGTRGRNIKKNLDDCRLTRKCMSYNRWYNFTGQVSQFVMAVLAVPITLVLLLFVALVLGTVGVLCWFIQVMQGPIVVNISDEVAAKVQSQFPHTASLKEKWFFVNGIGTNDYSLRLDCEALSLTVGREVTGIHNRTLGTIADVIECVVQRDLSYFTTDAARLYRELRKALVEEPNSKIVLVAHSQGGIVLSLVLDRLFSEFGRLPNFEVYTFASAANHFNSPIINGERAIEHMEHFANRGDFVSRIGVLRYGTHRMKRAHDDPAAADVSTYFGKFFIREDGFGHSFIDCYLFTDFLDSDLLKAHNCRFIKYFDGGDPDDRPSQTV